MKSLTHESSGIRFAVDTADCRMPSGGRSCLVDIPELEVIGVSMSYHPSRHVRYRSDAGKEMKATLEN